MTPFGSDFSEYTTFANSNKSVILGDGTTKLNVLGKGKVQRYVEVSPHKYRLMILDDVLHVQGINRRFLSMIKFDDKGFDYRKESNRFIFSKGNIQFPAIRLGNAYWIHLYSEKPPGASALNAVETVSIKTLHERMGHLNWDAIKRLRIDSTPPFSGISLDTSEPPRGTCAGCAEGKGKRPTFKSKSGPRSSEPIERIHADLTGPFEEALRHYRYACVFNCDCTRHVWVYFLRSKDQTLRTFQSFVTMVEKQTGRQIKFFRSDRGGEFMSKEFDKFLEEHGIVRETSAPETPQQNGLAERMMQTLKGGSRAMLTHSGMSKGFWTESMSVAAHVLNRSPRKGLGWRTPYELLHGHVPNISYFRIFGCRAWVLNEKATAWDPKMKPMIFVGYEQGSKAYRLWDPKKRSIVVSAKVRFDETEFPNRPAPAQPVASSSNHKPPPPQLSDDEFVEIPFSFDEPDESKQKPLPVVQPPSPPLVQSTPAPSPPSSTISTPTSPVRPSSPSPDPPTIPSSTAVEAPLTPPNISLEIPVPEKPRRSQRQVKPVERYGAEISELALLESEGDDESKADPDLIYLSQVQLFATSTPNGEPSTFAEARKSPDRAKWEAAMKEEIKSLEKMGTWKVVPRPNDRKVVGSKWVYRNKMDGEGIIVRFEARVVARGYLQQPGLDFSETFAPVTRLESIRLLLGITAMKDWEIRQIDVKTAYLYGDLDEEIFMEPPEGYKVPPGHVLLLLKALYGLKQAGRQWYAKLKDVLTRFGMRQIVTDPNTYVAHKVVNGKPCILVLPVYVDDLLPIGSKELTDDFEAHIGDYFEVTPPDDASHFLGIRISRNRNARSLTMDQIKFVDQIVNRFTNGDLPEAETPLPASEKLLPSEEPVDPYKRSLYQSLIGSLMYLMLGTRPDIAFAVGLLARFSSNPSALHRARAGRLLGYVKHTRKRYLHFDPKDAADLEPKGYTDSDYAGDQDSWKSTSGYVFYIGGAAFSWRSRLQDTVANSTMEAEYIALYHASLNAVWTRNFFEQIGMALSAPLVIYCDNLPTINVAKGEAPHKKAKHFQIKVHVVREHLQKRLTDVEYIPSEDNQADVLTKALPKAVFITSSSGLGLHDLSASPDLDHSFDSQYVDAEDS